MRFILSILLAYLFSAHLFAYEGNFLNVAILTLPDRYMADIPLKDRDAFLIALSRDNSTDRLDYEHGWVHFFSDGHEVPATSMLFIKLLPRKDNHPLVFVHMPKPFADGSKPRKDQTFVLSWTGDSWEDVTSKYIPKRLNLTWTFQPRRAVNQIEVAPYNRFRPKDTKRDSYTFAKPKFDLIWTGSQFDIRITKKSDLSYD
ncbi:MAG TPA: hypothetical protein VIT91_10625 [Chthoniobacterales bacterium]